MRNFIFLCAGVHSLQNVVHQTLHTRLPDLIFIQVNVPPYHRSEDLPDFTATIQNGVLRGHIQELFRTHPANAGVSCGAALPEATLCVLYLAVTEHGGDAVDGGVSYSQGKWANFVTSVLA